MTKAIKKGVLALASAPFAVYYKVFDIRMFTRFYHQLPFVEVFQLPVT